MLLTQNILPECPDSKSKVDLIFLLDGSGSINFNGTDNFSKILKWVNKLVKTLVEKNVDIYVGVIVYRFVVYLV